MSNANLTTQKLEKQVGVRLPDVLKKEINKYANKESKSSSQFVNDMLQTYFENHLPAHVLNALKVTSYSNDSLTERKLIIKFIKADYFEPSKELLGIYNNLETDIGRKEFVFMLLKQSINGYTNFTHDPIYQDRGNKIVKYGIYLSNDIYNYLDKISEITGLTKRSIVEKAFCQYKQKKNEKVV